MSDYRDDDRAGPGYCPVCGRTLTGLTVDCRGLCEQHGWQWAEWTAERLPEYDYFERMARP